MDATVRKITNLKILYEAAEYEPLIDEMGGTRGGKLGGLREQIHQLERGSPVGSEIPASTNSVDRR